MRSTRRHTSTQPVREASFPLDQRRALSRFRIVEILAVKRRRRPRRLLVKHL